MMLELVCVSQLGELELWVQAHPFGWVVIFGEDESESRECGYPPGNWVGREILGEL